ncbi:thiol-disulfide oxidoreductase DCC family protein [Fimbriimonas ginsengisoli]|uniref:Thiol-disulfide oxidoreductase DCC n=1 Tax=Fimbriimonas ginsengisoli Gsoil 348 TaxID=661478 RepID=A0A068NVF2_FIMGI|nr:DCC1-like thiol-disulfide oxidoreductase family protein [Fimbriimonas ginsengisoli]AIE87357.1 thiol-disulfide oxidoreductase DCC [Fimbriimonas ginsengisoli Gsoil 348]
MIPALDHPTLFFDGVCNLCNASVDWVIRHDKARRFRYSSLQGDTAKQIVAEYANEEGLSTVVLVDDRGKHVRSSAALGVLRHLGGFYGFLGALGMVIPRPLRDWGYRLVAKNRYRWFGKKDSCRLPTPAERALFLP